MNGNHIIVMNGSTPIAAVKSNDVSSSTDLVEVATVTSGQWKEYIAGRKEWGLNVSWLLMANQDVKELLNVGTTYTLKILGRDATTANTLVGFAILKTCKIVASRGNLAQGSFVFQGSGPLQVANT